MNRTLARFTRGLFRGCLLLSAGCSSSNDSASPGHADAGPWKPSPTRDGAALGPASDAGSVFLGRTCQRDLDCGMGLVCLLSDSQTLGGEGAPGGYCTRSCTADPSACQGWRRMRPVTSSRPRSRLRATACLAASSVHHSQAKSVKVDGTWRAPRPGPGLGALAGACPVAAATRTAAMAPSPVRPRVIQRPDSASTGTAWERRLDRLAHPSNRTSVAAPATTLSASDGSSQRPCLHGGLHGGSLPGLWLGGTDLRTRRGALPVGRLRGGGGRRRLLRGPVRLRR